MLSSDAKAAILFALGGLVSGAIGSRLALIPSVIVGILVFSILNRTAKKKLPDADLAQAGIMPYLGAWIATLVILANV